MNALTRFHAHVYFDKAQRRRAVDLRREIGRRFEVPIGTVLDRPVGPHSKGTFQVIFEIEDFARLVPWLMQHRGELDVLVHADSGDDYLDHTQHVMWLGRSQHIYADIFRPPDEPASTSVQSMG